MNEKNLNEISNPEEVYKKALKIFGKDVKIKESTRKNKKYMLYNPNDGYWIHFGSNMEDYTKHKDEKRRKNFQTRNHKWGTMPKYSASFLSYYLLW